jgi:competence protein ComEC
MNRPVVVLTIIYIAGIIIGDITGLKGSAALVLVVFSFSVAAAGYLLHWQSNRLLILVLFCLLGLAFSRFWIESSESALINYSGQRVVLKGRVVAEPDVREDKVFYLLQAQELVKAGETRLIPGLVRLQLKDCATVFAYGDILSVSGLLIQPDPAGNPGLFDYRTYLERQGIRVILTARGDKAVRTIGTGGANPLQNAALAIKKKMSAAATFNLNPSQSAVLNGIVFGTQGLIDRDTKRSFSETGVIHILSVSGLHVGLVLGGLLGMLRLLKLPPVWTAPLASADDLHVDDRNEPGCDEGHNHGAAFSLGPPSWPRPGLANYAGSGSHDYFNLESAANIPPGISAFLCCDLGNTIPGPSFYCSLFVVFKGSAS